MRLHEAMNAAAIFRPHTGQLVGRSYGRAVSCNDGSVLPVRTARAQGMAVRYSVQGGNAFAAFDAGPVQQPAARQNVPQDRTADGGHRIDDTVTDQSHGPDLATMRGGHDLRWPLLKREHLQHLLVAAGIGRARSPGNAGWRVPNVKELESLIDRGCANPAISGGRFPDQPAVDFWSSTPGWAVSFNDGSVLSGQAFSAAEQFDW